ncbi:MAG: hypothetical protein LBG70_03925 [Bifidobacteriaceae bacterium]|nr:hypothetical protein [Bifidobacteriaceae bacterium]
MRLKVAAWLAAGTLSAAGSLALVSAVFAGQATTSPHPASQVALTTNAWTTAGSIDLAELTNNPAATASFTVTSNDNDNVHWAIAVTDPQNNNQPICPGLLEHLVITIKIDGVSTASATLADFKQGIYKLKDALEPGAQHQVTFLTTTSVNTPPAVQDLIGGFAVMVFAQPTNVLAGTNFDWANSTNFDNSPGSLDLNAVRTNWPTR